MNMTDYVVDSYSRNDWEELIASFDDANIYQTYAWGSNCYGESNISAIVVRHNGSPIAAALVRILKVPGMRAGIAYIRWGPLWQRSGSFNLMHFSTGLRALIDEYVKKRGLSLRIRPFLYAEDNPSHFQSLRTLGYKPLEHWRKERTLLVDIRKSLDDLRKGLDQRWRNHLKRAEKNTLNIIDGTDENLLLRFAAVHEEVTREKRIAASKDINIFRLIQMSLPDRLKMRIFLCEDHGEVCAGIVVSSIGRTGITLLRATGSLGRRTKASYLLQWRALQWLKEDGCHFYDLSGIDPVSNPGTYSYKRDLCGRNGREMEFIPQFGVYPNALSEYLIRLIDRGILGIREMKQELLQRYPSWLATSSRNNIET